MRCVSGDAKKAGRRLFHEELGEVDFRYLDDAKEKRNRLTRSSRVAHLRGVNCAPFRRFVLR